MNVSFPQFNSWSDLTVDHMRYLLNELEEMSLAQRIEIDGTNRLSNIWKDPLDVGRRLAKFLMKQLHLSM